MDEELNLLDLGSGLAAWGDGVTAVCEARRAVLAGEVCSVRLHVDQMPDDAVERGFFLARLQYGISAVVRCAQSCGGGPDLLLVV